MRNKRYVVLAVAVVVFLAVLQDVRSDDILRLDATAYSLFVLKLRRPWLDGIMEGLVAGMNKAKGFFRSHLARALNLRHTPELLIYYDNLAEETERVERLLESLEQERKANESNSAPEGEEEPDA